MKKWIILGVNALVLVCGIFFANRYSTQLKDERMEMTRDSFVSAVNSMEQVSVGHLKTQQEYVDNWGNYINEKNLTVTEAMDFLGGINSNEDVSVHLIDPETFTGYSTTASAVDPEDFSVDYTRLSDAVKESMLEIAAGTDDAEYLHSTGTFLNPLTGISVIGFGAPVTLRKEDGGEKTYLLLRLLSLATLQEQWIFPTGYDDAEIGLITEDGDYVIRSSAMKSENFLEFIRAYNDLTYPQKDAIGEKMKKNATGVLQYKDARGRDSYWVYATLGEDTDNWMIIGYTPVESLKNYGTDWPLVLMVCVMLGSLFLVDGAYFILINRRLRESMEEANKANQAKTQFLSSMSHDIRTPMNAIIGMTSIAMRHLDDTDRIVDCLNKVTLASNHLLTLINDILDISKVESGKLNLNPMAFSLPELMVNLTNIVRPQIHAKSQDFQVEIVHMSQEYLYADELRINQIFTNILSNAVKYTPDGGSITLTLEEQLDEEHPERIRLIYSVADTGIGMDKESIETMFQPFTRAKDSRIDTVEGSGLGLAITKQMVDAMNGTITVESELGKGSVFTVTLELPFVIEPKEEWTLPPMRVLAADDDPIAREALSDMLASLGVLADMAKDGEEAVAMASAAHEKGQDYPLILMDWKMPKMDGVHAARAIRDCVGSAAPILILSAFDWSSVEKEALNAGVDGFINKPVFRYTLWEKINELLHLQKERQDDGQEEEEDFAGMHLLVAEDNELNWEIIDELLGFYEITADRAENGAVCVEMLRNSEPDFYDAVLMDIQMPVMKGDEAARRIRHSSQAFMQNIPIIAMTADAFAEDVQACLDAGMNAHVAKPIDIDQLLEELRKVREGKEA